MYNNLLKKEFIYKILAVLPAFMYSLFLCNKTLPAAEGWYTYYAQCINSGEIVYKDFDYLFTPLYIHIIALFTKVFGYKIIYLRLLGVLVFSLIGLLVFLIFKEIFNKPIALITTITSVMYLQSEVVQIFYDYIRFLDLFILTSLLFLILYVKDENHKATNLVVSSIFASLAILTKQNTGLVFLAYSIVFIIAFFLVNKRKISYISLELTKYLGGALAPIVVTVLLMINNGSLSNFLNQGVSDALAAKGGGNRNII